MGDCRMSKARERIFVWQCNVFGPPSPAIVYDGMPSLEAIPGTKVRLQPGDTRSLDELVRDHPLPCAAADQKRAIISDDDAERLAAIRVDSIVYVKLLAAGDERGCLAIEQRYGLAGLPPQQVSERLAAMLKQEGGTL